MLSDSSLVGIVPTVDVAKARSFYCDVLGLTFEKDDGFALVLQLKTGTLRIVRVGQFTPQPFTLLGWEVSAIEKEVQQLAAAGVTFERYGFLVQDELGIWTAPDGSKVAWFKDPDGNVLSVSQHGG